MRAQLLFRTATISLLTFVLFAGIAVLNPFFSMASSPKFPQARFLFVTEHDAGKVAGYVINPTNGSFKPTGQAPVWAHWGPLKLAANKSGTYLYVANEGSHDVSVYSVNRKNGYLSAVAGSPFRVAGTGSNVAVHPSGKYVYVTTDTYHGGISSVSAFSVASNGSLAPVPGSPFLTQAEPEAVAIDPSGKFLYTADFGSDYIDAYAINSVNGALTPVPGEPYRPPLPKGCVCGFAAPLDIAIDPSGTHLYTADAFAGSVAGYSIDRSTGSLFSISGSPFIDRMPSGQSMDPAFNPYSIAIRPQGNFAYGYDSGDEDISIFGVNATTGALKLLNKTPNTYGGVAAGDIIRIDPSGQYVYALGTPHGQSYGAVLGFHINPTTGDLTPVPGSPLKANVSPFTDGVAVTP